MKKHRPDIDGMRMIAVVPVVLCHAGVYGMSGGFIGVDVFFVISGFLITGILYGDLEAKRFSLIRFYERRARRILPALMATLLACFIAGWIVLYPDQFEAMAKASIATALFGSNFHFWRTTSNYFAPSSDFQPLLHTWTLAVEEQFYIFFPPFLWLMFRHLAKPSVVAVTAVLTISSALLAAYGMHAHPNATFYLLPFRAWELGVGALLAIHGLPVVQQSWLRNVIALISVAGILLPVFIYDSATVFPFPTAIPPVLGTALLIWLGSQGDNIVKRVLSLQPIVFIGLISYSFYLWHWPILALLRIRLNTLELPIATALTAVLLAFVVSCLSWRFVEQPFRRSPPKGLSARSIFRLSTASMAAVIALASTILFVQGAPSRFDPRVLAAYGGKKDVNVRSERCRDIWPRDGLCKFGADPLSDRDLDFLLWGDSHAGVIMTGVETAAIRRRKTGLFAGYNACPPLLGIKRLDQGADHKCDEFNSAVLSLLMSRNDIPLIILSARWALAAEGSRVKGEPGQSAILGRSADTEVGPYDIRNNFELFKSSIIETVRTIRATGRKVVILGPVPEIGWDVPQAYADALRWKKPLPPLPNTETLVARYGRTDEVFEDLAAASEIVYLPVVPHLCRPACRVYEDGKTFYFDNNHLSQYGANSVITPILMNSVWK